MGRETWKWVISFPRGQAVIGILGHLGNRTGQLPYGEKDNGEDMCEQKEANEVRWPQEDMLGDHSSTDAHRERCRCGV